jgi:ribosomal protein S18 acetylase RimI-like enzyme
VTAPEISATNLSSSAAKPPEEHRRNSLPPSTYAFRLFMPRAGEEPLARAQREALDYADTPPDEQKESRKRQLADALMARISGLQLYQFPYHQIACFERISIEQARCRHRHLELNSPEGGHGIQIILRDDEASVTVPFWHETAKAVAAFREVWTCLETLRKQAGYLVYDTQLGRMVELETDAEAALACYIGTLCRLREEHSNGVTREKGTPRQMEIRELAKPEGCGVVLLAVSESGAPCGFAEISIGPAPVNGSAVTSVAAMTGWYVEPAFRGRGIGRRLLDSAQAWAKSRGLGELAGPPSTDAESPAANGQPPEMSRATVDTRA